MKIHNLYLFLVLFSLLLLNNSSFAQNQTPELVVQIGHTDRVNSVAFSHDGKYALSGSNDKTLKLWDINTGKEVKTFAGHTDKVNSVAFSPDGKYALSGSEDMTLKLWDINTGREVKTFSGHKEWIESVAFSPDGRYALSGSYETIKLWDINSGKEIKTFLGHNSYVKSIALSPDGRYVLSGSSDSTVKLWNISSGKQLKTFSGHKEWIESVAFSPEGKYALSGSGDKTLKLWDINSGKEVKTFSGHTDKVYSVAFSPDGKYAISGSRDKTLKLWDINKGKEIKTFSGHNNTVLSVAFSPDGKYALSGCIDFTLKLWDINSGKELKTFSGHTSKIYSVAFSPDGKYALSGSGDKTLKLWDINLGEITNTFSGHTEEVTSVAFSPDGKFALSGSYDKTLKLWDINTREVLKTFSGHNDGVRCVAFSPDGKYTLSGSYNIDLSLSRFLRISENSKPKLAEKTLILWDINSGKEARVFSGYTLGVTSLAFSPDGEYAVTGGEDFVRDFTFITGGLKVKLWGINFEKEEESYFLGFKEANSVAFSPDGIKIISGNEDKTLMLWDTLSEDVKTFSGHTEEINSVCFSPDGKYILSGSADKTIMLWNTNSGEVVKTFLGHTNEVKSVCFSTDGKYILSGSDDNRIKIWNVESGSEIVSMISFGEKDYIIITPDNYYKCSKNGLQSIAFIIGNDVYPPEQFDLQYNRPDIILERIGYAPRELIDAYRRAYEKRLKKMKFDEGMFNKDFHMPEMKILDENIPLNTNDRNLTFKIKAEDTKYLLDRINVFVNDVPIYGTDGIDLRDKKTNTYNSDIKLELSNGKNKVQVSVLNDKGVESLKETFDISYEAPEVKHDLYVVAIGASDYNDSRYKLNFAAKDAKDIGDLFLIQKDKYNDVKVLKLLDKDVTRENILKAKEFLMQSKVDDEVIVFIGGHGLLTKDFDYYFATADIDFTNPQSRGVTFEEIEGLLDGIPARQKVLLMDTCHSGELDKEDLQIIAQNEKQVEHGEVIFRDVPGVRIGRKNENEGLGLKNTSELMQEMFVDLRRGSGAAVISSSGGLEVSYEGGGIKNGLFTYCIIEGLKTQNADLNKDGKITVSELRDYVSDKVEKLTKGVQKPTTRKENLENDFRVW